MAIREDSNQKKDISEKYLFDNYISDFLFPLGIQKAKTQLVDLDSSIAEIDYRCDKLVRINDKKGDYLLNAEFFTELKKESVFKDLFKRSAFISIKGDLPVVTVLYLIGRKEKFTKAVTEYGYEVLGKRRLWSEFELVYINEMQAEEVINKKFYGLIPFVLLMTRDEEHSEKDLIDQALEVLKEIEDQNLRNNTIATMTFFSSEELAADILNWLRDNQGGKMLIKDTPLYKRMVEEDKRIAEEEGLEKGEVLGKILVLQNLKKMNKYPKEKLVHLSVEELNRIFDELQK